MDRRSKQSESSSESRESEREEIVTLRKRALKYLLLLISAAVTLIGILLLVFAHSSPWPEITTHMGIALTTAGTVGIAIDIFTRKEFEIIVRDSFVSAYDKSVISQKLSELFSLVTMAEDFRNLGIKNVYNERNDDRAIEIIKDAAPGSTIKLLGTCLRGFTAVGTQRTFTKKLIEGCKIELLVLDSESDFVRQRAKEEGREYSIIKESIDSTNKSHDVFIKEMLEVDLRDKIMLEYYDAPPNLFLVITDTTVLIGFYMRDQMGQFFPQIELEIKPRGISKPFIEHFDSLMRDAIKRNKASLS